MRKCFYYSCFVLLCGTVSAQDLSFSKKQAGSIENILRPDGSIDLKKNLQGSFNLRGYGISYKENGEPVFLRTENTTVAGDENWDPQFAVPGVDWQNTIQGHISTILIDGEDVYVGGVFNNAGGIAFTNIAKWNGGVWSGLGGGLPGAVLSIKKFGNDLYVATETAVVKWNGSSWITIGTVTEAVGPNLFVGVLEFDAGGNLYAGGAFGKMNGLTVNCIAKWNGSAWSAMGTGLGPSPGSLWVSSIAVIGTNVYIGGGFSTVGGVSAPNIARWNGSAWNSVGGGTSGSGTLNCLAVIGTDLYAAGGFTMAGGVPVNRLAKWNGSSWSALGNGLNQDVQAFAVLGSDLYAAGPGISQSGSTPINIVGKWDGSTWSNAGNGLVFSFPTCMAITAQHFFIGGATDWIDKLDKHNLARWDGNSWQVVGNGANSWVNCVAIDGNNIYIGGNFTEVGGLKVNRIAKWNGNRWDSLGSGFSFGEVRDIAIIGNLVYAGGSFQGSPTPNYLAVWNGSTWSGVGSGVSYRVNALATRGTDLYVGGEFGQAGGVTCNYIAKWNGSAWSNFGFGMNNYVRDIQIASDGTVYVAGDFTTANGATVNRITKWNGTTWAPIAMGVNGPVYAIAITASNEVYIGGMFDIAVNCCIANRIAKFNGTNWIQVGGGIPIGGIYTVIANGNDIYIGGDFSAVGGVPAENIAKWNGSIWEALGSGVRESGTSLPNPTGFAINCNNLYVVGHFLKAGDKQGGRISRYWINGRPSVTISTANTTVCAGSNVVFTAQPVNGGSSPIYQWKVNGISVGTNSPTYSSSNLANNSVVQVLMSGNSGCVIPVTSMSNAITMTIASQVTPSISITGNTTVNQGGSSLITSSSTNGGSNPAYTWSDSTASHSWQIIPGATAATHNYTPSATGNKLRSVMTSNANCASPASATSNTLTFTVNVATALNPVPGNNFGIRYYPNPVNGILYIDSLKLSHQWQDLHVVALDGKEPLIKKTISNRTFVSIAVGTISAGEYMIVLTNRHGVKAYLKFIKQ